tara:strand:+ start:937 stop:1095 length:159 start_codon:yes stop_codon:yes gene_type:complete
MTVIQTVSTILPAALVGNLLMGKPIHLLLLGVVGAGVSGYVVGGIIEGVIND